MGSKKKIKRRFGMAGGVHGKNRALERTRRYRVSIQKPHSEKGYYNKMKFYRVNILRKIVFGKRKRPSLKRQLFIQHHRENYIMNRVSRETLKFKISKVVPSFSEGYRFFNLKMLQNLINAVTIHVALCSHAQNLAKRHIAPVKMTEETKTFGLASFILADCQGCGMKFNFESSPQIRNGNKKHYDVNTRAVWGSMVTGGGVAHLNECMATLNAPGMSQQTYTKIEQEIGDMWGSVTEEDLLSAGAEERRIAIEKGSYHEGVPAITVICDGGWSKRSHKHSYNAMGGCAIIIGAETGKLLHIGVRNKFCYICSRAECTHTQARPHRCFRNWNESSQSMESDIILEGFLRAEATHGLRYTRVIADGDASTFAKLQENVPLWGKSIEKVECANHMCKCLRTSLEKMVDENPLYKGRNKFPKSMRIRLVSAVRCAIRMRSKETDKSVGAKKMAHDIRNSVHHIFGNHSRCSDFCKSSKSNSHSNVTYSEDATSENTVPDIISGISEVWKDTTSVEMQEESRCPVEFNIDLDSIMLRDISVLLDRVASKSARLMGNYTTNLAESWMSIRAKFDGGKLYNRCNRGSWHSRCFGGSLRMNLGPQWSPTVWEKTTKTEAGYLFKKLYMQRDNALTTCRKIKLKPEIQARRWKRKYQGMDKASSKKAKMDYGSEAVDSLPDLTSDELEVKKQQFMEKHINLSEEKIKFIENSTKSQSVSAIWVDERKKRLTASNFGSVVKRNPSIPVKKLVHSLLYSTFKGNTHTRRGLLEESMTIKEYCNRREEECMNITVEPMGLVISREHKFLAASPDGKVVEKKCSKDGKVLNENASVGLLEVKNLLHSKPLDLFQAAEQITTFCLELEGKNLRLKKNHQYYFQVQGQLNITKLQWADFVVRTLNPYQMHIQRIYIDQDFWNNWMLPKLKAFYLTAILPELSSPRNNTLSGIREPGVWYEPPATSTKGRKLTKTRQKHITDRHLDTPVQGTSSTAFVNGHLDSSTPVTSTANVNSIQSSNPASCTSPVFIVTRTRRTTKLKFVGRRISHEWVEDETTDSRKWYNGTVISIVKGRDGDPSAVYEVLYDGEDDPYIINHLIEDFRSSSVRFIDI